MPPVAETILLIISGVLVIAGVAIVYAAPRIVDKKKLDEAKVVDPERIEGLNEEGVKKFKRESAILDIKVKGVLIALPGAIIILILCRI
ncbi:MAG: hypothetical protein WC102_04135 [Saccharofermentanales bacterium]